MCPKGASGMSKKTYQNVKSSPCFFMGYGGDLLPKCPHNSRCDVMIELYRWCALGGDQIKPFFMGPQTTKSSS